MAFSSPSTALNILVCGAGVSYRIIDLSHAEMSICAFIRHLVLFVLERKTLTVLVVGVVVWCKVFKL